MKELTPLKAIRAKCLDCSGGSAHEVRGCHISDCSLHPYRFGKNPKRAGIGSKNGRFWQKSAVEQGVRHRSQTGSTLGSPAEKFKKAPTQSQIQGKGRNLRCYRRNSKGD